MRTSVEVAWSFGSLAIYDADICDCILTSLMVSFIVVERFGYTGCLHGVECLIAGLVKCGIVIGFANSYGKDAA